MQYSNVFPIEVTRVRRRHGAQLSLQHVTGSVAPAAVHGHRCRCGALLIAVDGVTPRCPVCFVEAPG